MRKISLTTAMYQNDRSDLLLVKLQILHKQLIDQQRSDKHRKFANWVKKLNILDYQRATRSFFAELKSKSNSVEHISPIKSRSGQLSTTLQGCLQNWASYYSNLYNNSFDGNGLDCQALIKSPKLTVSQATRLNADISMSELIRAIDKLKDYSTPGEDMLLSRDFTILLHVEVGKKSEDYPESWNILHFLKNVLSGFWKNEKVRIKAKESILRPFLKAEGKDPTNPKYYRPIALLSTIRKVYEQIIKTRLQRVLEESNFFSKAQAAYRHGHSYVTTC